MKAVGKAAKSLLRLDGWQNILTGLGYSGKDKRLPAEAVYERLAEGEAEELYASDEMATKIVDMLPLDMLREGFELVSPDVDEDILDKAMDYFDKLVATEEGSKLGDALIWGRMYGGAALVIGTNDEDTDQPLEVDRLDAITHLTLLNRFELIPQAINADPTSNNFGMPETYTIQPRITGSLGTENEAAFANSSILIHHSRLLRFDGAKLPRRMFITNHYWHDSILNKLQDDIRDYQAAFASAAALILDFAQAVYKVKNLADIIAAPDGKATLENRIAIIDRCRSILRAAIVDADGEDFERKTTTLAGLDKTLDKLTRKFTSATEYPHTVLLGESPSGMGATGDSERDDYYTTVRARQVQELKPRLLRLFKLIFAAGDGPTGGMVPENLDIEFMPLKHLDQKETIEARKQQAEADKIYMETGAVDPLEIATSRFGSGEYSFETEIDMGVREGMEIELDDKGDPVQPQPQPDDGDRMDGCRGKRKKGKKSRRFNGKRFR